MNHTEDIIHSNYTRTLSGKWWLCFLFLPSILFSQFHVVGDTKITINNNVIVSNPDSSLVYIETQQRDTVKIYVVEGTKVYGFEQNISNEIAYVKLNPKTENENRSLLTKKESPAKTYSQESEVTNKKLDSFKIVPVSIPSGSFSSAVKLQHAVLTQVIKRQKISAGEFSYYRIYRTFDSDDCNNIAHPSSCDLIKSDYKANFITRPPPVIHKIVC